MLRPIFACLAIVIVTAQPAPVPADQVGCGQPAWHTDCEGCQPVAGTCSCVGGNCNQTASGCTNYPSAFEFCPEQIAKNVFTTQKHCQFRFKCNNSQGQDLGPCVSECEQSQEKVEFGDARTVYQATGTCICEPTNP